MKSPKFRELTADQHTMTIRDPFELALRIFCLASDYAYYQRRMDVLEAQCDTVDACTGYSGIWRTEVQRVLRFNLIKR